LWNRKCFEKIGALVGTLMEIDEATLALERLEYSRLCIKLPVDSEANFCQIFEDKRYPLSSIGIRGGILDQYGGGVLWFRMLRLRDVWEGIEHSKLGINSRWTAPRRWRMSKLLAGVLLLGMASHSVAVGMIIMRRVDYEI